MDEITINTANQTPIEIALGIDEEGMTTAGTLFDFLRMDRSNFSRWFRTNIIGNGFAEENTDYFLFVINDEQAFGSIPHKSSIYCYHKSLIGRRSIWITKRKLLR